MKNEKRKMNPLNQYLSNAYDYLSEGAETLQDSFQKLLHNLQESEYRTYLQQKLGQHVNALNAAIQAKESQVEYLQEYNSHAGNESILQEIQAIKQELDHLKTEKAQLEQKLQGIQEPSQDPQETVGEEPAHKQQIRQLKLAIAQDKIQPTLEQLHQSLNEEAGAYNEAILLASKMVSVEKQLHLGLISSMEYNLLKNRISYSVLELLSELEAEDFRV